MIDAPLSPQRLRELIGREVNFCGQRCRIIEVLEDGPMLVLGCEAGTPGIQPNQHGEATRRVPRTHTLPLWDIPGKKLNPDVLALGLIEDEMR